MSRKSLRRKSITVAFLCLVFFVDLEVSASRVALLLASVRVALTRLVIFEQLTIRSDHARR